MRRDIAFLDRDGVLNVKPAEGDYVTSPEDLVLVPGAAAALARLSTRYELVLVTNQRGIARGLMSESDYERVNDKLLRELRPVRFRAQYHCPHDLGQCRCRKPQPGMLLRALSAIPAAAPSRSVLIGDSTSDVEAAVAAGVRPIHLSAGESGPPAIGVPTLDAAVDAALELAGRWS